MRPSAWARMAYAALATRCCSLTRVGRRVHVARAPEAPLLRRRWRHAAVCWVCSRWVCGRRLLPPVVVVRQLHALACDASKTPCGPSARRERMECRVSFIHSNCMRAICISPARSPSASRFSAASLSSPACMHGGRRWSRVLRRALIWSAWTMQPQPTRQESCPPPPATPHRAWTCVAVAP
jgi:hypothetical protein